MKQVTITTEVRDLDSVRVFFRELRDAGFAYHPDDSGAGYGHRHPDGTWHDAFDAASARRYDENMDRAFALCRAAGIDIYELGMTIDREDCARGRHLRAAPFLPCIRCEFSQKEATTS